MDRLICGDVGFGKTEVALARRVRRRDDGTPGRGDRADDVACTPAFKGFAERFKGFPVKVAAPVAAHRGSGGVEG